MVPNRGGRFAGVILAVALALGVAAATAFAANHLTEILSIKGKKLYLFSEAGKRIDSMNPADVPLPLKTLAPLTKGKFKVLIPAKGEVWILKAQTVTSAPPPEVAVSCDQITKVYAASRGLGDCN